MSSWWEWGIDGMLYAADFAFGGPTGESLVAKSALVGITKGSSKVATKTIYVKGYGNVVEKMMHPIKKRIFNKVGKMNFLKAVGNNPDIVIQNGKIVLQGTKNGPFSGKTYQTNLDANVYFK